MTKRTQQSADLIHREQQFRRGWHPEVSGYVPIRYQRLGVDRADRAWRGLVQAGWSVARAPNICEAMKACKDTAARCRRAFDALDLITNHRGYYSTEAWGSYVTDGVENIPAVVELNTRDPEAFVRALPPGGEVALYVASRSVPGAQPAGDWTVPSSLRSSGSRSLPRPPTIWWDQHGVLAAKYDWPRYLRSLCHPQRTTNYIGISWSAAGDTSWWVEADPPPGLVIARDSHYRLRAKRAAPPSRLLSEQPEQGLTIRAIMAATGWSRKTTYRRVDEWLAARTADKVCRGRYRLAKPLGSLVE